jgi:hypothetical protein
MADEFFVIFVADPITARLCSWVEIPMLTDAASGARRL